MPFSEWAAEVGVLLLFALTLFFLLVFYALVRPPPPGRTGSF